MENNGYDLIIFTDGSTKGHDKNKTVGWTGAAAITYNKTLTSTPKISTMSIENLSNNYEGELFAINLALDEIVSFQGMAKKVCILSDCRPALYQSFSNNIAKKYNNILNTIRGKLLNLHRKGTLMHGFWCPGIATSLVMI